jgi:HemK-related putative methylase
MNARQPTPRKHGLRARIYIVFLRLRFHLFQRHRHNRLVLETVAGKPFVVLPQVFNPALFWTSEFFARTLNATLIPPGSRVLDLGTGSGINGIFAAQWAGQVIAVDLNPAAVRCARINALLNQVEDRVEVRQGDLFDPVRGEQFDVILFNPPFFKGQAKDALEKAFFGSSLAPRFAAELAAHLTPDGVCLLILASIGDEPAFLNPLAGPFQISVLAQHPLPSETLTIYQIKSGF